MLSSCEGTSYLDYDYTITYETFGGTEIESIEVKLEGDLISFNYDKEKTPESPSRNYIHRGIAKRSFNLGYKVGTKFDLKKATANFHDGLLIVTIPFAKEAMPKVLKIN